MGTVWRLLFLIIGVIVCWTKADDFQDKIQMAAMTGVNVMQDFADKFKPQGSSTDEFDGLGIHYKKTIVVGEEEDEDSEERRRRRRSAVENNPTLAQTVPEEHRHKRSPCKGRYRATTTAPPANTTVDDELARRRRKRSTLEDDMEESSRDFTKRLDEMMKNMVDMMNGFFQNIVKSFQSNQTNEM